MYIFWGVVFAGLVSTADAALLQYPVRTSPYSGFSTTIRGDDENVGMAGATVALPTSISSLENNPSGLTMTMGNVSAQINSNRLKDRTSLDNRVSNRNGGLAIVPGRWGYGFSYVSPITEQAGDYRVKLQQFNWMVSRFFSKKWSVGASLVMNQVTYAYGHTHMRKSELSYKFGVLRHWDHHILTGVSFAPSQTLGEDPNLYGAPELPGFSYGMEMPAVLNVGVGWMPNRFFRVGLATLFIGKTGSARALRDQSIRIGEKQSVQPRFGFSYTFADYSSFKVAIQAGAYYEDPRIDQIKGRMHRTFAIQINPWFVNTSVGVDRSGDFHNTFVGIGIDVVRFMRTFDLIPPDNAPPYNGVLPNPFMKNADGLPSAMTISEEKSYLTPSVGDVREIIQDLPQNVKNKLEGKPATHESKPKRTIQGL